MNFHALLLLGVREKREHQYRYLSLLDSDVWVVRGADPSPRLVTGRDRWGLC